MDTETFWKAHERQKRAWLEARDMYDQRTSREKNKLRTVGKMHERGAQSLGEVFDKVNGKTCQSCSRCCSLAAYDSGFFSHGEREVLLTRGIHWEDFIVLFWPPHVEEPQARCLFLAHNGCNIPREYRSTTCLNYVCRDRLGPTMASQNLEAQYKKARKKLMRANAKLRKLPPPPYSEKIRDFSSE